jgi:GNAT superfamily N-acetyltransferase
VVVRYLKDLLGLPADVALAWRHRGFAGVRNEIAHRTLWAFFRWNRLSVWEQPLSDLEDVRLPDGVTIELFRGDWFELAKIAPRRELHAFRRAAAKGRHCLVARRDGRPIGYTWTSLVIEREIERFDIPLPPDAAYGWNLYVIPSERNSGTGTALVSARLNLARSLGRERGWRVIAPSNAPSKRTLEKASRGRHKHVAELVHVQIGPIRFDRYRPIREPNAGNSLE